jgi:hypothetical protein
MNPETLAPLLDVALDYVGGGGFDSNRAVNAAQLLHQLNADQRFLWRTSQLAIRDSIQLSAGRIARIPGRSGGLGL